jgi:general secretion pathway protein H
VALIGVLSGALIFGSGFLGSSRERAAATLIMSGVRMGLSRATSTGRPTRLSFNLDEERVTLEEATDSHFVRDVAGDAERAEAEENQEGDQEEPNAVDELEEAARSDAREIVQGLRVPRPSFTPVTELETEEGEKAGRQLSDGVEVRFVQTQHDEEPRTRGKAYLYFWAGGQTEHAVIHLGRGDGEGLSVIVSALTGRAQLVKGEGSLPKMRVDGEVSERDEE